MMTALDVFSPAGKANEYRDARRLAICYEVVADLLHTMTGPEEWYRFRTVFFGSPDNRHNQHNLRVSLCLYDSVVRMCNTLSALPFGQLDETADSLKTSAATLRDRARLRIRWRRAARLLRKVV